MFLIPTSTVYALDIQGTYVGTLTQGGSPITITVKSNTIDYTDYYSYEVNLVKDQIVNAKLEVPSGADFDLFFCTANMSVWWYNISNVGGQGENLSITVPESGNYNFIVADYSGSGTYTLTWTSTNTGIDLNLIMIAIITFIVIVVIIIIVLMLRRKRKPSVPPVYGTIPPPPPPTTQSSSVLGGDNSARQEIELYSFGPWGVNVCFSRPGTFAWMQKNNTKIVLTNKQIYGSSTFNNSKRFQVSYPAILAKENFNYRLNLGLWNVLWIKYSEGQKIKEVSIMGFGQNSFHITKAFDIISCKPD